LSGTTCVSFTMRNSTGSMPSFSAISSIAISSAARPGASLGARIALCSGRSSATSRLAVMRFGPAYSERVCTAAASGLPPGRSADQLSWAMAVILPSFVAPMRMRCRVAERCTVLFGMMARSSTTFTGRRAARAPRAASTASARIQSFPPKPPPM
jgi:hypothetical protein